ncbi:Tetraacyldisaccharide 4'-kinase [Candidatus Methylomirabilis lanthanidiphila]|uniref:Tetraacyldisaccharide 4'-kinase n=1 Tax=Candidatus Methylomirabilis lanthanidiphila TaxID=2211376 RepID=A0A564ZLC1_9BACT|nr:tetraacyldisaccharide 4'-kinase [Candidatus Methylomirabilis lanthanidiphila]VUZ85973.1 Tetraacyldisaccharide 4'-kinase [Candidatus Methylomirabilis lanthanidiphila]
MKGIEALSAWTLRCMAAAPEQWAANAWLTCLRPVSRAYGAVVSLRTALFSHGLVGIRRLPVPVLSVGNLSVGGSGKTPFVEMLAGRLHQRGQRVVIILRGYKGGSKEPTIVSDGRGVQCEPPVAADEAYLLARHLPGVAVLTGADRHRVGQVALEQVDCGVIILDDGFQHLRLHRDLDIVLVDAINPLGYGRLLPSGLLREPPEALKRADMVVLSHADVGRDADAAIRAIRQYTPVAPIVRAVHRPVALVDGGSEERSGLERLRGRRLLAVSGIAHPGRFEATLVQLGACVAAHRIFPDHHRYTSADLKIIHAAAEDVGASMVVTTEKDMVKLARLNVVRGGVPLYALSISLELIEGAELLDAMLNRLMRPNLS